jgi:HEPN domain-containing protein
LTKQEHIEHWKTGAEDSWESALVLMNSNHNSMAAFCFHLSIEKFLKAIWIKNNQSNTPPRIHNLIYLHDGSKLNLDEESKDFLKIINTWNQEGRYQEYVNKLHKAISKEFLENRMNDLINLKKCLQEKVQ